ncbi:MAG: hypothetical protein JJT88_02835 [Gammaproteobacteria bacterium]|nr:hypothetical protein [Gammaproteobacteria bacterium]
MASANQEIQLRATLAGPLVVTSLGGAELDAGAGETRIQHDLIGSDFPIARAVEVPAGANLLWHSGLTPRPLDPNAPRFSREYWGDTRAQTISVMDRMVESLDDLGLSLDDIVKMTVFLVPDPQIGNRMDFAGFMEAYREYFGAEAGRMNLPARSTVGVADLVAPGMLVEIEAIFVRR